MHVDLWREVTGSPTGKAGILLLATILGLAVFAPLLSPYSPSERTDSPPFSSPSSDHWLGTNDARQDIWTRLAYGARTSLTVAGGVSILSALISLIIGGTCALFGGNYDRFWMRVADAMLAIPSVIIVILVAAYIQPNLYVMILLISLLFWPGGARVIRSQTLSLQERMHVSAARTFGAGWPHILFRHILPDMAPVMLAIMIQDARGAVFMEAGLSFLGLSDASMISWGKMMQFARAFTYLEVWKWWLLPTGIALSSTLLGLSLVGYSLESALDPRLRSGREDRGSKKAKRSTEGVRDA